MRRTPLGSSIGCRLHPLERMRRVRVNRRVAGKSNRNVTMPKKKHEGKSKEKPKISTAKKRIKRVSEREGAKGEVRGRGKGRI